MSLMSESHWCYLFHKEVKSWDSTTGIWRFQTTAQKWYLQMHLLAEYMVLFLWVMLECTNQRVCVTLFYYFDYIAFKSKLISTRKPVYGHVSIPRLAARFPSSTADHFHPCWHFYGGTARSDEQFWSMVPKAERSQRAGLQRLLRVRMSGMWHRTIASFFLFFK